ncbi:MAG: deoxycytidylate deaminase [Patescibacteria group bacterium UBA2163]
MSRPTWDEYFLEMIKAIAGRATCDRGRSGSVIVRDRRILSSGYVGAPMRCKDCDEVGHEMHTVVHDDGHESQHCIRTTHAEQNAIALAARDGVALDGATLYCNMTPCYTCAKMIINAGIVRVVAQKDYHAAARSKEVFTEAGVALEIIDNKVEQYENQ